jgi:hypothetical protein
MDGTAAGIGQTALKMGRAVDSDLLQGNGQLMCRYFRFDLSGGGSAM